MNLGCFGKKIKTRINRLIYGTNLNLMDIDLINIRKQINTFTKQQEILNGPKILFGPSFGLFEPMQVQDFFISQSLILRGAKIIPLSMGTLEEGESSFGGGFWTNLNYDTSAIDLTAANHNKILIGDKKLWQTWCGLSPLYLSDYLSDSERERLRLISETYALGEYKTWHYDEMPVGHWALDVLRNNYMVGDETLVDNYQSKLQGLLFNIILCIEALRRLLDVVSPDIIVSNDSFYYPWSALEFLAKQRNISFYSYWAPIGRGGACAYARNEPSMALNFTSVWKTFKNLNLSLEDEKFIDDIFNSKKRGRMLVINTASPESNNTCVSDDIKINFEKPTVLLAANVVWDLAALNKEIQFENMFDWIINTVQFFKDNPQWQLVVKPHPVEENRHIPITQQRVKDVILSSFEKIPDNVILLDPKTKYDVYYFFNKIKVGLVFTSTVGLEMVCHGIPVMPAGKGPYFDKGFTYDTKTKEEYFKLLTALLTTNLGQVNSKEFALLAKKFFKLNFFHYFMHTNLFDYAAGKKDGLTLNVSAASDLMPGKNMALDYICDSILNDKPIVSEDRWPPFISGDL